MFRPAARTVSAYFSPLASVLIVHDSNYRSSLQQEYLDAVQQAIINQTAQNVLIGIQWLDTAKLTDDEQFQEQMLRVVDIVTEGFITILPNTERFLHARYYATRNTKLRLKDKFYLFLCEHENPKDFLANQLLQFYPHHLMIVPATINDANIRQKQTTTRLLSTRTFSKINKANKGVDYNNNSSYLITASRQSNRKQKTLIHTECCTAHRDINFELWTQKFIGTVGNLVAVFLDAFLPNETFTKNVELYPNKVSNLKGRTMRVGSITYIPYVVTNYVKAGSGNVDSINTHDGNLSVSYVGSEANLILTFCQVRNCHLRLAAYGEDNWGIIYDNETADGMLGDLYLQHVELAIGCVYNWYDNLTETSHTIARSAVTILGPAPALYPAWRTNIMPFTNELWIVLIATMVLCVIVMFLIKLSITHQKLRTQLNGSYGYDYFQLFQQSFLDIFAVFIQQPSAETAFDRFAARIFLAVIMSATITLENTYSGQLKSILTLPFYTEPVDTMQKWSLTNWKWAAPSIIWIQTVEKSDLLTEQILTRKFEIRDYDFLYNASFRDDYGLGIERLLSGSFSFGNYITEQALEKKFVVKDDLYFDWTRAVSIRGWPLMPLLNKHVRACMETGLFIHWEKEMVSKYLDIETQEILSNLASGHTTKAPPQKLTIANISGALFALIIGYMIASFVLLLEIFGHALMSKLKQK